MDKAEKIIFLKKISERLDTIGKPFSIHYNDETAVINKDDINSKYCLKIDFLTKGRENYARVAIYIEDNIPLFDFFYANKERINDALCFPVKWVRNDAKFPNICRIKRQFYFYDVSDFERIIEEIIIHILSCIDVFDKTIPTLLDKSVKSGSILPSKTVIEAKDHATFLNILFGTDYTQWNGTLYSFSDISDLWIDTFNGNETAWLRTVQGKVCIIEYLPRKIGFRSKKTQINNYPKIRLAFQYKKMRYEEYKYEFLGAFQLEEIQGDNCFNVWKLISNNYYIENLRYNIKYHVGGSGCWCWCDTLYKKENFRTRDQIDEALKKLALSAPADSPLPTLPTLPVIGAMCYMIRMPSIMKNDFVCDNCHIIQSLKVEDTSTLVEEYKKIVEEFNKLGHWAEIKCYCDDCAKSVFSAAGHNIVFAFRANGDPKIVYSYPSTKRFDSYYYDLALDFLKGADTSAKLKKPNKEAIIGIQKILGGFMNE